MLVNLYESKTPIAVFSFPLLVAIVVCPILFLEVQAIHYPFEWQNDLWSMIHEIKWLNFILAVFLISTNAHQINNAYNSTVLYSKDSFLPGLIYLISLVALSAYDFAPILVAHFFFILAMRQLFKIRRQEDAKAIVFKASLLFGIGFVFSPMQSVCFIIPALSLTVFRPFVWREWFMVVGGGFIAVIYYLSVIYLSTGQLSFFSTPHYGFQNAKQVDLITWVNWTIFGLIALGSIVKYFAIMRTEINRFKKQSQVLFHMTWVSFIGFVLGWYFYSEMYPVFILPLSIIVGTQLLHSRNSKVVNAIVIIWLIISVANVVIVG
ncbi:MAG: hypothetical protein ABJG68_03095 [Crocinitomicaceae bacterium]